jgi:hypothetical protein
MGIEVVMVAAFVVVVITAFIGAEVALVKINQ